MYFGASRPAPVRTVTSVKTTVPMMTAVQAIAAPVAASPQVAAIVKATEAAAAASATGGRPPKKKARRGSGVPKTPNVPGVPNIPGLPATAQRNLTIPLVVGGVVVALGAVFFWRRRKK